MQWPQFAFWPFPRSSGVLVPSDGWLFTPECLSCLRHSRFQVQLNSSPSVPGSRCHYSPTQTDVTQARVPILAWNGAHFSNSLTVGFSHLYNRKNNIHLILDWCKKLKKTLRVWSAWHAADTKNYFPFHTLFKMLLPHISSPDFPLHTYLVITPRSLSFCRRLWPAASFPSVWLGIAVILP